jgi:indolepyruvate ferredoxin oxidoreductase
MGPEVMIDKIDKASKGRGHNVFVDANRLAEALFGSHLAVNIFLTGVAWQAGLIPISLAALEEAVQLNGVDIEKNLQVFNWGRKYYSDAQWVESHVQQQSGSAVQTADKPKLDRATKLEQYQNAQYANKYREFVEEIGRKAPALRDAVERNLYKLMAIKDEYEVARLLTDPVFEDQVRGMWQEPESIGYNLHPPLLRQFGFHKKIKMGAWARPLLKVLAALKGLRGGPLDVFGYGMHRRMERSLIGWYQDLVRRTLERLTPGNTAVALEIVSIPDHIRGYEQIKEANVAKAKKLAVEKLAELDQLARAGVAGANSKAAELMQ